MYIIRADIAALLRMRITEAWGNFNASGDENCIRQIVALDQARNTHSTHVIGEAHE